MLYLNVFQGFLIKSFFVFVAPQQLVDPLEWLGVTRSDSPELVAGLQNKASAGQQGPGKGLGNTIVGLPQSQADISLSPKALSSTFDGRLNREDDDNDSDWLGIKKGSLPPPAKNRSKSSLDWLFDDEGKGESKTFPGSLSGIKSKEIAEKSDDYLGFGAEVKLGATSTPKESAKLETGPNFMRY